MYLLELYVGGNGPNTSTTTLSNEPSTIGIGFKGALGLFLGDFFVAQSMHDRHKILHQSTSLSNKSALALCRKFFGMIDVRQLGRHGTRTELHQLSSSELLIDVSATFSVSAIKVATDGTVRHHELVHNHSTK